MTARQRLICVVLWAVILACVFFVVSAHAQEKPSITAPTGVTSSNQSTTIVSTNVYQSVLAKLTTQRGRLGCTIVNYGANTMWVFEDSTGAGLTASNANVTTTKAKSVQLAANQAYYCANGGTVIVGAIFITGTSGDAFYAGQQ